MESSRASANEGERLTQYMRDFCKSPPLSAETEQSLCRRWIDYHDVSAAHQLVNSHLRLVIKIARDYRGYRLPLEELIGEGNVGLMRAVCRFDPDRGARFATYAVWWVQAAIQQYILHKLVAREDGCNRFSEEVVLQFCAACAADNANSVTAC